MHTTAKSAKEKDLQRIRYFLFEKTKANAKVTCHKIKLGKQNQKKKEK